MNLKDKTKLKEPYIMPKNHFKKNQKEFERNVF